MPKPIKYGKGWRVNFAVGGKRFRLKFKTKENAQDFIYLKHGEQIISGTANLNQSIDKFFNWAEKMGKLSKSSIQPDRSRLNKFALWCDSNNIEYVQQITVTAIRNFQEYFYDNHPLNGSNIAYETPQEELRCRKATWKKYRNNLSSFFKWCVDRNLMENNIIAGRSEFSVTVQKKEPRYYTDEELDAIFEFYQGQPVETAFFKLLLFSGLRLSEAIELRWKNLDLNELLIKITNTKNNKPKIIPLDTSLIKHLNKLPKGRKKDYVFDNGFGGKYCSKDSWYYKVAKALKENGFDKGGTHGFRHSFGTGLARTGAHPKEIQSLLGHSTINMAMYYSHFAPEQLRKSIKKLPFKR